MYSAHRRLCIQHRLGTWTTSVGFDISPRLCCGTMEYAPISLQSAYRSDRCTAYMATILWGVEMLLLKYSILCLYLRIFPNQWLKWAVYAFMAFTACFTLPLILTAAIRCNPVRAQWDLQAAQTAKCLDWLIILKLTVVYEVVAEIVLFTLPIPIVVKLQMATAKKVQLLVFFGLGLL